MFGATKFGSGFSYTRIRYKNCSVVQDGAMYIMAFIEDNFLWDEELDPKSRTRGSSSSILITSPDSINPENSIPSHVSGYSRFR